jgi:hypothetical protein
MTNRYDNQTLHAYLLGRLPEEDVERLDEMTFTDPDFAEELTAAEKDLIDAYVNGELNGEDLLNFESYYLATPLRRKKVTFARALNDFTAEKEAASPFVPVRMAITEQAETGWLRNLLAGRMPIFGTAAAFAAILLLLFGAFLVFNGLRDRPGNDIAGLTNADGRNGSNTISIEPTPFPTQSVTPINANVPDNTAVTPTPLVRTTPTPERTPKPETPTAPVIATFFLPPPLRGAGELVNVKLAPKTEFADFSIGLETNDFASYRIELRGAADGRQIWQSGSVRSRGGKSLNVRVPARVLKEQIYSFTVQGNSAAGTSETVGDYSFRVIR